MEIPTTLGKESASSPSQVSNNGQTSACATQEGNGVSDDRDDRDGPDGTLGTRSSTPGPPTRNEQPYGMWTHPYKTFQDRLMTFMVTKFVPFRTLCTSSDELEAKVFNDESITEATPQMKRHREELVQDFREKYLGEKQNEFHYSSEWKKITKLRKDWVSQAFSLDRVDDILVQCGIVHDKTPYWMQSLTSSGANLREHVEVLFHGPKTYVSSVGPIVAPDATPATAEDLACVLRQVPKEVPVILWFHGGGMMFCSHRDGRALHFAREVLRRQDDAFETVGGGNTEGCLPSVCHPRSKESGIERRDEMVLISVKMGLAPEHPFPHGLVDCLSALVAILDNLPPDRRIHIAGESAGANYAAVVTMEAHRRFPGRVQSSLVFQPMLCPAGDSVSMYMNSQSSLVPPDWLCWAWRVYLSLPPMCKSSESENSPGKHNSKNTWATQAGANRELMSRIVATVQSTSSPMDTATSSGSQSSSWHRLFSPHVDLPPSLDNAVAPTFIVVTSTGDPLRDDGIEFVNALNTKGANVTHLDTTGSHSFGPELDMEKYESMMEMWRQKLFASKSGAVCGAEDDSNAHPTA